MEQEPPISKPEEPQQQPAPKPPPTPGCPEPGTPTKPTNPNPPEGARSISLWPIDQGINDGQPISINVDPQATIADVKEVFSRTLTHYNVTTLSLWTFRQHVCEVANTLTDDQHAADDHYWISQTRDVDSTPKLGVTPVDENRWEDVRRSVASRLAANGLDGGSTGDTMSPTRYPPTDIGANARPLLSLWGLLIINHGDTVVLTRSSHDYKDIEKCGHRLFSIDNRETILISAKIPRLGAKRINLEPRLWATLYKDVSEIWVTTRMIQPKYHMATLVSIPGRQSPSLMIKINEGARISDIKIALNRVYHASPIESIQIKSMAQLVLSDSHPAVEQRYHYSAVCSTCSLPKKRDYGDSKNRYYAVPPHACLDPMSVEESNKHSKREEPTPSEKQRKRDKLIINIVLFLIFSPFSWLYYIAVLLYEVS
ncbi:hypothetical protein M408DRAFT_22726 [Serendipita vermifera MAFF 305830]|uniref:Uncharacterized protein n=1 Tax=Serendipita vermifera MAFF 305830 TaxID=933852 RepID=A0A0C2WUK2_SERVB|nr:hypothetical protein M408DRAFT_22726 [Serendipita vermifera MAFF 305830]